MSSSFIKVRGRLTWTLSAQPAQSVRGLALPLFLGWFLGEEESTPCGESGPGIESIGTLKF